MALFDVRSRKSPGRGWPDSVPAGFDAVAEMLRDSRRDPESLRAAGTLPVPMRVPPHLARPGSMMAYPLALPTAPLDRLAPSGSIEQAAMAECLSDGPPQHALANAAMVWLLGAALAKLDKP